MLTPRRAALATLALTILLASQASAAQDDPAESELRRPGRLTVGVADDLLGQLSRDGRTLYFVSNRDTAHELFTQNLADGRAHRLFDEDADVTWPRVSPDGGSLLYISFREHVPGQLCIRRLPAGDGRRCFQGASAALQAEWIDERRIALVGRQTVEGDLRVLEVTVTPTLSARTLLNRNVSYPAVSPDGRWLVYVPVERTAGNVGPAFAARAAPHLEAVRLGSPGPPATFALPLPGLTGQPLFSRDGRFLYVVQFLIDTNQDGVVDGRDDGVLFRVPISLAGDAPVTGAPEQLTQTSWNCEYPTPFADRLLATCSRTARLEVYSLPLDGAVPAEWSAEALGEAMESAGTRVEQQLLASRQLARETTPAGRRQAMLTLALLHLKSDQFVAAQFYAEQVATLRERTTAGISLPLKVLVEQRRAERRRQQGRMMGGFRAESSQRLDELQPRRWESPAAESLRHIVRSRILASLGDMSQARAELEAVAVDEATPSPILEVYYESADDLYRELDDREALVSVCRKLAANAGLSPDEQLRYARAAVRATVRGMPYDEAELLLARERADATGREPEFVFAIDLARAVLSVRDAHPPRPVIDALGALYAAQARPGRRVALMADAVQRAEEVDADEVLEALAAQGMKDDNRGARERTRAKWLFRRVMLGRAYERAAAGRYDDARADFEAVAEQTGAFEAVVGAIDMRLIKGEPAANIESDYGRRDATTALARFAKAYLLARQLPALEGEAHARAAADALDALGASWQELKDERMAQALFGALLHEKYVETGDLGTAEMANHQYLVALELMGHNARVRALILGELGILHTSVRNYRIALSYTGQRDMLPYTDGAEALAVRLSEAEALLHVGREGDAATAADEALAMVDRSPALAPYRLLSLDCAAIDNLAAERFARALALYTEEIPLIDASQTSRAERNRIVTRVARAAAAVGAGKAVLALSDLDTVDARLGDPKVAEMLRWPRATAADAVGEYRLITAGLRASANRQLGRLEAEAKAIEARQGILQKRLKQSGRVEIVREQMLAEAQLALNASQRRETAATGSWLGKALAHADELHARAHGVSDQAQLDMVWLAAQLTVSMGVPLVKDLSGRIDAACGELAARRDPVLRPYERWLEIYGVLVRGVESPGPAASGGDNRGL